MFYLYTQKKNIKKEKQRSRSTTPQNVTPDLDKIKGTSKRKQEVPEANTSKKPRTQSPLLAAGASCEGVTEDAVRRYLMRKPMTTKDLLQKFKSKKTNTTSDQMASAIAQILKKINPDQTFVNKMLYLSLKTPDK